jgi:hypothetical protein
VVLPDVAAPVAVGTGRSLALTSGSAVRLPPEKVTVFVSGRERGSQRPAIFALDAEDHARRSRSRSGPSRSGAPT